jgi:hypothetical protein
VISSAAVTTMVLGEGKRESVIGYREIAKYKVQVMEFVNNKTVVHVREKQDVNFLIFLRREREETHING